MVELVTEPFFILKRKHLVYWKAWYAWWYPFPRAPKVVLETSRAFSHARGEELCTAGCYAFRMLLIEGVIFYLQIKTTYKQKGDPPEGKLSLALYPSIGWTNWDDGYSADPLTTKWKALNKAPWQDSTLTPGTYWVTRFFCERSHSL